MNTLFPEDSAERKEYPVYSGALQYFPSALAAVANHSFKGNEKHNPGQPLHHDRAKSGDEADALVRHLMEGDYVGMAWRALALLQKHLEAEGAPIAPGARNAKVEMVINTPSGFHLEGSGRDFTIVQDPPDLPLGWLARGGIPVESAYLASFGRTTYRPKCCASAISATCRHAIRCTPKRCANTTNGLTARRIRCDLRSNPACTDAARYASPVHRIRRPADHPVYRAEADRGDFLVMDLGTFAVVAWIRHCAACSGGLPAVGGAVVSASKSAVLSMLADGLSQREVSRRTGVSRKTLYRWAEDLPKPDAAPRRHFIIPDTQCKPGEPLDHLRWIGKAVREYKPDVLIHIGDHWDFPSLSTYSAPESGAMEGLRYEDDLKAGNDGLAILHKAMGGWQGRKILLRGNHEDRLTRYLDRNPKLSGAMGFHQFNDRALGWDVVGYHCGSPGQVTIDGVIYAHYFAAVNTGRAIGGTAQNKLNHVGTSFVQGHVQGYEVGTKQYATGVVRKGIVAGSAYLHDEDYKGMANAHWRGVVVLNEVRDGQFCEMPLTLAYLCRKYEGMPLYRYLREHYETQRSASLWREGLNDVCPIVPIRQEGSGAAISRILCQVRPTEALL